MERRGEVRDASEQSGALIEPCRAVAGGQNPRLVLWLHQTFPAAGADAGHLDGPERVLPDDLTADGIATSVLYPTLLLGIAGHTDIEFAEVQCRAYNDWLSDHVQDGDGRLFAYGV